MTDVETQISIAAALQRCPHRLEIGMGKVGPGAFLLSLNSMIPSLAFASELNGRRLAEAGPVFEAALVALGGAGVIYFYPYAAFGWKQYPIPVLATALLYAAVLGGRAAAQRRYERAATSSTWYGIATGVSDNLRAAALLIACLFVLKASYDLSRVSVFCLFVFATLFTIVCRLTWSAYARAQIGSGRMVMRRFLLIGERSRLEELRFSKRVFVDLADEGVKIESTLTWQSDGSELQNDVDDIVSVAISHSRHGSADDIVLFPGMDGVAEQIVERLGETPVTIHVVPSMSASATVQSEFRFGGLHSFRVANSPFDRISGAAKRAFDVAVSLLLLFLLIPLFLVLAAAIKLESEGPVFFRQTRHGYGNRHFKVIKFRSMRVLEDGAAFRQAVKNDPRVTRTGRFMRETNLDELPQLINVLLGEMSLVGPRPHPIALNESFEARIGRFHRRHNIRPGITGWAQVNGFRGETDTYEKMVKRVEHDIWYVDNWSFALDLRILVSTMFSPVAYRNAG